jgi:hypothetical protein
LVLRLLSDFREVVGIAVFADVVVVPVGKPCVRFE